MEIYQIAVNGINIEIIMEGGKVLIDKRVNGRTSVFTVIGDPVSHSSSPVIQNTLADILERDMIYTAMRVSGEGLETAIKGAYELGIKGINVTVPHKSAVMKFLCGVEPVAEQIGAVNTLKYTPDGYRGTNTDILGILYTLKEFNKELANKKVLLLGAGGAAKAAAVLSLSEGCSELVIANRTLQNAEELKAHLERFYENKITAMPISDIKSIDSCDIVFNATTVGFADKEGISPIADKGFFERKSVEFVFDAIYTPWETRLLKDARECGVACTNGFPMLVYQAAGAQEFWFDEEIPAEIKVRLKDELTKYYGGK